MKRCALILALLLSTLGISHMSAHKAAIAATPIQGKVVPGQYIVVLKDGVQASGLLTAFGIQPKHTYSAALNGFSAQLNDHQLNGLRHHPSIAFIEQDRYVSGFTTQFNPTWGLDRIDQRFRPLSNSYSYGGTGAGVTAYVIDSGLQADHPEFGGRAANVYNSIGGVNEDCHGHGTHTAGTIGSATYGVAKQVQLRGVKVLDCSNNGTWESVIAGIEWVQANAVRPAVANLSLGGPQISVATNTAASNLANSGVFVSVAAGNGDQNGYPMDACTFSPASASGVLTVAASTSSDTKWVSSNYGTCVELYAPGANITSTWKDNGTLAYDGTSMATAYATGVAALYKSYYGDTASETIYGWMLNYATRGVITNGFPNRLLYKGNL